MDCGLLQQMPMATNDGLYYQRDDPASQRYNGGHRQFQTSHLERPRQYRSASFRPMDPPRRNEARQQSSKNLDERKVRKEEYSKKSDPKKSTREEDNKDKKLNSYLNQLDHPDSRRRRRKPSTMAVDTKKGCITLAEEPEVVPTMINIGVSESGPKMKPESNKSSTEISGHLQFPNQMSLEPSMNMNRPLPMGYMSSVDAANQPYIESSLLQGGHHQPPRMPSSRRSSLSNMNSFRENYGSQEAHSGRRLPRRSVSSAEHSGRSNMMEGQRQLSRRSSVSSIMSGSHSNEYALSQQHMPGQQPFYGSVPSSRYLMEDQGHYVEEPVIPSPPQYYQEPPASRGDGFGQHVVRAAGRRRSSMSAAVNNPTQYAYAPSQTAPFRCPRCFCTCPRNCAMICGR